MCSHSGLKGSQSIVGAPIWIRVVATTRYHGKNPDISFPFVYSLAPYIPYNLCVLKILIDK
jgi:hypothetical protein